MKKYTLVVLVLCFGCKPIISCRELDGLWIIQSIVYNDANFKKNLSTNALSFKCDDSTGHVPLDIYDRNDVDYYITWELNKENKKLKINSSSKFFNETFSYRFSYEKDNIYLYLDSKNTHLILTKAFR